MAFSFTEVRPTKEVMAEFTSTKDTELAKVCREIVAQMADVKVGQSTGRATLEDIEIMFSGFQDWQTKQRDRRAGGDLKAQVVTIDAIARKLNSETEQHKLRAVRRNGGVIFSKLSDADIAKLTEKDDDAS
jgi:hypothetical protein